MLENREVEKFLSEINQIKTAHRLADVHVHPFEVLFNDVEYKASPHQKGVYSSSGAEYGLPSISNTQATKSASANSGKLVISEEVRRKCLLLALRHCYLHTGPKVFGDQMQLSGIDRVLLLPVSVQGVSMDSQMSSMADMFDHDDRYAFGYSVPDCVENDQVKAVVQEAINRFNIKAIKLHPAISGINLQEPDGVERVECILSACRETGLSIIVHGGKSSGVRNPEAAGFGELGNLRRVNWSLSPNPVVIAHAGLYDCSKDLYEALVPLLNGILEKNDNVMIDLSGICYENLCRLLNAIDTDRIVFGSDSLYYSQWQALVFHYSALKQSFANFNDRFIRIASVNASKVLGGYGYV